MLVLLLRTGTGARRSRDTMKCSRKRLEVNMKRDILRKEVYITGDGTVANTSVKDMETGEWIGHVTRIVIDIKGGEDLVGATIYLKPVELALLAHAQVKYPFLGKFRYYSRRWYGCVVWLILLLGNIALVILYLLGVIHG
jgi:hypothetical protein